MEGFCKDIRSKDGHQGWCKECTNRWNLEHRSSLGAKEKEKNYRMIRKYGLTLGQVTKMLEAQDYRCYICGVRADEIEGDRKWLGVDHCHNSGGIRKMLCDKCNRGLGYFGDNPDVMRKAVDYLEEHGQK